MTIIVQDNLILEICPGQPAPELLKMADFLTPEQRSRRMSRIKGKNTKPEILLRKLLHQSGLRYRLHRKDLPGSPDIVLPRYKTVIFVHGCFWHHHQGCKIATTPKTNTEYWLEKFEQNNKRDTAAVVQLEGMGWRVMTVWECELSNKERAAETVNSIISFLKGLMT